MLSVLKEKIRNSGSRGISYEEYMAIALYHPEHGYYQKEQTKIGRMGDFYTSSSLSGVFGAVWANIFYRTFSEQALPFVLCEIGAGNGRFAKSVMEEWKNQNYPPLEYVVIESSPFHERTIKEELSEEHFTHYSTLEEYMEDLPAFQGIVFGNELLDAMPVRVIRNHGSYLSEVVVGLSDEGELAELEEPLSDEVLHAWLSEYMENLEKGQTMEVPLVMTEWLERLYAWISKGTAVFVDYGYTNKEWKLPHLRDGSLRGYYQHQQINQPLMHPGNMDLTAHVHWDCVQKLGKKYGFASALKRQTEFLMENGILNHLGETADRDPFSEQHKKNRAVRSLILDESISQYFQVLIQKKDGCL